MTFDKIQAILTQLWQKFRQSAHGLDQRTHGWLGLLVNAVREALKPDTALAAAAIAYFALFSVFPIILVSITIASFHLIPLVSQQFILDRLEFIVPAFRQLLGPNINRIVQSRGTVTLVALIGLIWSSSNVFNMLNQAMSDLWGYKRVRPLWKRRGMAILVVLVITGPVLIVISIGGSVLATLYGWLPIHSLLFTKAFSIMAAVLLNIALFELLYYIFPHGSSLWRDLLPGAITAGILWEFAKQAFLAFVSSYVSVSNLIYGSVGAIIAFLTWAYLSGLIFLFGAFMSQAYYQHEH